MPPRRRRAVVAVAVTAAVVGAGLAVGVARSGGGHPPSSPVGTRGPRPSAAGGRGLRPGPPATAVGGVPMGFGRDEAGARAAGIAYATANQAWLYLSDVDIEASVRAIATPDAAPGLVRQIQDGVGLARDALATAAGPVWWVARPLAVRVASYSPTRATVAVWVVSVLSATGVAVPQSTWVTTTVELRWADGDWRLAALADRPGPTPVLDSADTPWQPEALDAALAGFERLGVGR